MSADAWREEWEVASGAASDVEHGRAVEISEELDASAAATFDAEQSSEDEVGESAVMPGGAVVVGRDLV